jgi:hypothetical protein
LVTSGMAVTMRTASSIVTTSRTIPLARGLLGRRVRGNGRLSTHC